jgi:hypothetical protein
MSFANQESTADVVSTLVHSEAVTRLAGNIAAIAALDRQIELCTDPRAESCLLTLRVEHEVDYLEALYGWAYQPSGAALLH